MRRSLLHLPDLEILEKLRVRAHVVVNTAGNNNGNTFTFTPSAPGEFVFLLTAGGYSTTPDALQSCTANIGAAGTVVAKRYYHANNNHRTLQPGAAAIDLEAQSYDITFTLSSNFAMDSANHIVLLAFGPQ